MLPVLTGICLFGLVWFPGWDGMRASGPNRKLFVWFGLVSCLGRKACFRSRLTVPVRSFCDRINAVSLQNRNNLVLFSNFVKESYSTICSSLTNTNSEKRNLFSFPCILCTMSMSILQQDAYKSFYSILYLIVNLFRQFRKPQHGRNSKQQAEGDKNTQKLGEEKKAERILVNEY